jgi:3-methyladenine DNA glycosylase/8-oxoguanine DNA glycosylase
MSLIVSTPEDFSYKAIVQSHGWLRLAPYHHDDATGILSRDDRLAGQVRRFTFTPLGDDGAEGIRVSWQPETDISEQEAQALTAMTHRIFQLDTDIAPFYACLADEPDYAWVQAGQHGRFLVSPTLWEDMVKILLTTNTTWAQTIAMTARVCALGEAWGDYQTFPAPERIANASDAEMTDLRLGYRADYLQGFAQKIVEGLDIEAWRELPADDAYKQAISMKGFGAYAVGSVMRLMGHHATLPLDTVARASFKAKMQTKGAIDTSDSALKAFYEKFGVWRGLVLWMDCLRY